MAAAPLRIEKPGIGGFDPRRLRREFPIFTSHPELVFLRLNFGRPLPSKKTEDGIAQRMRLLRREGFVELKDWLARTLAGAKEDDILDACAVANATAELHGNFQCSDN